MRNRNYFEAVKNKTTRKCPMMKLFRIEYGAKKGNANFQINFRNAETNFKTIQCVSNLPLKWLRTPQKRFNEN